MNQAGKMQGFLCLFLFLKKKHNSLESGEYQISKLTSILNSLPSKFLFLFLKKKDNLAAYSEYRK